MNLAVVFPGQGSQRPGALAALPDHDAVRAVLAEAEQILGAATVAALDEPDTLHETAGAQLQLLIAGVATARALTAEGFTVDVTAGHSVGAFAAAVTAAVLTFAEALAAVARRGQLMAATADNGRWGMAAVQGLDAPTVRRLAADVGTPQEPVWPAVYNAADQIVLSGTRTALADAEHAALAAGARRVVHLDVAVAAHCPRQDDVAQAMTRALAPLPRRPPTAAVITTAGGRRVTRAEAVYDDLARSVALPVQWYDAARLLPEIGVTHLVQTPPGRVLVDLLPSGNAVHATALGDGDFARHLDDLRYELRRTR
ncbi:ACP S-malonyltransferase [Winogradskya humida]|uniref:[acyl-carrier-protein] S-malonyltransferase n=1 Tax=Winogradskya humida TaxID=113566 RepID=A0ABQ4A6B3_9ACTN|nr:acyltransferase domain-containing protein [Actinoplanes humidus]GIE26397.1 malonate decarboxylase subunit epsilon [Actinoplanes humidus]